MVNDGIEGDLGYRFLNRSAKHNRSSFTGIQASR